MHFQLPWGRGVSYGQNVRFELMNVILNIWTFEVFLAIEQKSNCPHFLTDQEYFYQRYFKQPIHLSVLLCETLQNCNVFVCLPTSSLIRSWAWGLEAADNSPSQSLHMLNLTSIKPWQQRELFFLCKEEPVVSAKVWNPKSYIWTPRQVKGHGGTAWVHDRVLSFRSCSFTKH